MTTMDGRGGRGGREEERRSTYRFSKGQCYLSSEDMEDVRWCGAVDHLPVTLSELIQGKVLTSKIHAIISVVTAALQGNKHQNYVATGFHYNIVAQLQEFSVPVGIARVLLTSALAPYPRSRGGGAV